MAEVEFAPDMGAGKLRGVGSLGGAINIAGAVISVALIVGIGVWGYKLMVRDVSGVPVVRAIEGPMRVQPTNPGGRPADHQGLAVNAVAARGEAAPTPDTLVLAPRPVDLEGEDAPLTVLADKAKPVVDDPETARAPAVSENAPVTEEALVAFRDGSIDALVTQLTEGVAPLEESGEDLAALAPEAEAPVVGDVEETDTATATATVTEEAEPAPFVPAVAVDLPGVKRSLRPLSRPATLSRPTSPVTDASLAAAAATTVDVDPATLPTGTRLAQLGAYDSPDVAKDEWGKMAGRFADYISGKARVIQKASSGGRTFYRLRVMGFDDLADARRFCSALVAEGADCIPVVTR